MNFSLKKLILLSVLIEVIIFVISYFTSDSIHELFRFAARYSGRFSLIIFLITFYNYATSRKNAVDIDSNILTLLKGFAIIHVIHFFFLATNIYLNNIALEIPKIIGGALAYLMIVSAPFKFQVLAKKYQILYFYYVSLVMIMTYVARIKGDFEGAEPFWFHYLAFGTLLVLSIIFGVMIRKSSKKF